jgi:DNA polymerase (family 10)
MELSGENPFKVRSYSNGARTIEQLDEDLETVVEEGRLENLKGVGEALAQKIEEMVKTGRIQFLEDLRDKFPPTITELFDIQGLGPKRIKQVYDTLGVASLKDLEAACQKGSLTDLKGFSAKMQDKLLEGIAFARRQQGQFLINKAFDAAERMLDWLREGRDVQRIELAGSLRRHKELVKDIDLVASSKKPKDLMQRFVDFEDVERVVGHGETKSSVVLKSGIAIDLRVVTDEQYPYALAHFTGSKAHNVVMRQRAKERDLKLNEYGLFKKDNQIIKCKDEEAIYKALELSWIPPELREDMGEFEAEKLPKLIEDKDVRGVIHCHTTYSDGRNTLEEMVEAAQEAGYEYIVITDHSQSAGYAGGLKPEKVAEQQDHIKKLNKKLKGFKVFSGIESDIRTDGSLDYDEDVLKSFDFIVASVHQKLDMTEDEATKRVVRALENPYTAILGHPTGRLLLSRKGFPLDMEKIYDAAVANNVAIEINANYKRLDCDWRHLRRGKEKGVRFSIGPDAHRVPGIEFIRFGVGIARKGWLEPKDVIATYTAKELLAWRK